MAFTTMNVTGDIVANLMICKSEWVWDAEMVNKAEISVVQCIISSYVAKYMGF
jgi:hypothetical protein